MINIKQRYLVCDISLCHDCNCCFIACKDEHVDNDWQPYTQMQPRHGHRWMNILRTERGQYPRIDVAYLPMPCQHCADAGCLKANPGCVHRREDGVVLIDAESARGNRALVDSCPYGAIYWNEEAGVAQKCTMCAHLLDDARSEVKAPRCAHSCPTGALEYFYMEPSEMDRMIEEEALCCYRPELCGGKANVYYKNLYRFTKLFIAGGLLKDGECAEGIAVALSGADTQLAQISDCFGDFKFDGLEPGEYTVSIDGSPVKTVEIAESTNIGSIIL